MKHPRIHLTILMLISFLISCKEDQKKDIDTRLDIAMTAEPAMLHPYIINTGSAREVYQYLFLSCADYDSKTLQLSPILLSSIPEGETITEGPNVGGKKFTLQFRDDAQWDNGTPITGEDYLFSVKAIKLPFTKAAAYRSYLQNITDVKVHEDDKKKVDVIFKDPYMLSKELAVTLDVYPRYHYDPNNVLAPLSIAQLDAIDADKSLSTNADIQSFAEQFNSIAFGRESISGSGPYRLREWIANQLIVLEKKENYWGEGKQNEALNAGPKEIAFHFMPDETSVITQMKENNIDLYKNMSAEAFFELKENPTFGTEFEFFTPELMRFYYIGINNSKPELADPDVRRALAKLVDVNKLIEIQEKGLGKQTVGIFHEKKGYYNKDLKPIQYDLDGAKNILADEGWKDTNADGSLDKVINNKKVELDLDLYITGSALGKAVGLLMQESAREAGVKINIITKPFKEINEQHIKKRDYDLVTLALGQDLALDDPYAKWHSDNDEPGKPNDISFRSKLADELIDKIRASENDEERRGYYLELQKVMYDEQPVIFLYNPTEKIVVNKRWNASTTVKRPGYLGNTFSSN